MRKAAVASLVAVAAVHANASDWRFITSTAAFDLYADAASITPGPTVKVWVRIDAKPPYLEADGHVLVRGVEHWMIDCQNRRIATSDYSGYDQAGQSIASRAGSANDFHDIAPDTVWDAAASELCKQDALDS